jgi:chaperonin GroES
MSEVMSAFGQAEATQPSDVPSLPPHIMPRRPPIADDSLGQPQQEEGERRPLLRHEIVQEIAYRMSLKNIATELDEQFCNEIAETAKREYKLDDDTRLEWKTHYKDWLKFALQIADEKNYPWPNASNVIFPLITVASLQFNARSYPAIVMGKNVVKGTVIGDDRGLPQQNPQTGQPAQGPDGRPMWVIPPGAKQGRADKIGRHMSWQLLHEQMEWEEQTDRLLIVISICGTMFRKSYFDPGRHRNVSETVDALRIVVNYNAKAFDDCARISEEIDLYPWEIETNIRSGLWLDYGDGYLSYGKNVEGPHAGTTDDQSPVTFIEQHRRYDIDGDGYDEPVIVTFARDSGKLARITLGFDEDGVEATHDGEIQSITPIHYYTKYGFIPNPDGSPYDIGFGKLLFPLNAAINTSINQMFDAGHLQIAGGGFIGAGASLNTGAIRFMTGEWKVVNTQGRALRENLVPMQFPGPNAVLMALLEFLVASAKDIASINEVLDGKIPGANVPGILGLALIQQGLKIFNAIFKRVHRSLRQEFEKLFRLNRLYLPDQVGYRIGSEYFTITRKDYAVGGGVEPVSDPEMVTDTQQMAQANFLLQFIGDPFFDQREIRLRAVTAASIQQVDKLIAAKSPPNAEMVAKMAELDLAQQQVSAEKHMVELRGEELRIRAAHQEAELAVRRGKDKAVEIRELTQAILNLANAKKADSEVDQNWYALQLQNLRHQIDILNAITPEPSIDGDTTGKAVADIAAPTSDGGGGSPGAPPGVNAIPSVGLPSMAPPSPNAGLPAVPG